MRASLKSWCDENEPAGLWRGASTAFRAGARARVEGRSVEDCRYKRGDLGEIWRLGFKGMDELLSSGVVLVCDLCGHSPQDHEACPISILETERLRLRSLKSADFNDYAKMYSDPEVMRYLIGAGGQPWDRGRSFRHMAYLRGHWLMAGSGSWAVEHKESGKFIGVIGYSEPEGWPGLELAWNLRRPWWGFGYATEGARAALEVAFTRWKRDEVISLIYPDNQRSIRVAERLGETLKGRLSHNGIEMLCYGIERESYLQKRNGGAS